MSIRISISEVHRVCKICGKEFTPGPGGTIKGRLVFCSDECASESDRRNQARYQRNRRRREKAAKTVEKTCPFCGKSFTTSSSKKIYCSPACQKPHKLAKLREQTVARATQAQTCEWCGATFTGKYRKRFCSEKCADASYKARLKEKAREERTLEKAVCQHCGLTFKRNRADKKFCSDACRLAHRTVVRHEKALDRSCGGLTDAQRRQVEADMRVSDPDVRYGRSKSWTPAMRRYAARLYLDANTLRAGTCTCI